MATSSGVKPARAATAGSTLKHRGRTADRVLDAVQHVDHAADLARSRRRPAAPIRRSKVASGEKSLIWIGSGAFDRSPIMSCSTCDELDVDRGLLLLDLGAQLVHHLVDAAAALALQLDRDVAGIGLGHRRQSELQPGAPRGALHLRASRAASARCGRSRGWSPRSEVPAGMM